MSTSVIAEKYAHDLTKIIENYCDVDLYDALMSTKLGISKLQHGVQTGTENLKQSIVHLEAFEKACQQIEKKLAAKSLSLGISLAAIIRTELEQQIAAKTEAHRAVSTLAVLSEVGKFIEVTLDALDYVERIKLLIAPKAIQGELSRDAKRMVSSLYYLAAELSAAVQQIIAYIIADSDNITKTFIYKFIAAWIYAVEYRYDFTLDVFQQMGFMNKKRED